MPRYRCPRCWNSTPEVVTFGGQIFCRSCFDGVGGEPEAARQLINVLPPVDILPDGAFAVAEAPVAAEAAAGVEPDTEAPGRSRKRGA